MHNKLERTNSIGKFFVEMNYDTWIVMNVGECGIIARAVYGNKWTERSAGISFASRVLQEISSLEKDERGQTPRILINTALAVNVLPESGFICTTWQCFPDFIEICSVGTNSILMSNSSIMQEAITRHSVDHLLNYDEPQRDLRWRNTITHILGNENGCHIEDIRVFRTPLLQDTKIAIIVERRLAYDIIKQKISPQNLSSFIDNWSCPPGRKNRTSVLLSL
ncbi:hypothetical protein [Tengunoibacter tsumagoiensis]|uniref:Uncharacterized protein n=1 Tax=Tengunoibacter tsumagoiensis TaxID=2014871 RepID=A0A401ZYT3_9CHLR|nr:hypothetical protein [Tengunoibacter tsumagoiensis]GCE12000.1 hypothetical protein KTT_18590 [Tengunoibacter tsumagoiensis]